MKHRYRIVIVEDSTTISNALKAELAINKEYDFELWQAFSLKEAYPLLDQEVDFVLLDLELPDGEGEEVINYLRTHNLSQRTKCIVLTGHHDNQRRDMLFQLGALDYLSKDNPIGYLSSEVINLIRRYTQHQKYHVLVVDDSSFMLGFIHNVLENQNYHVITSKSGEEALTILQTQTIHLLILDLEMPGLSGLEVLRRIRERSDLLDLPILTVSGTANHDLISRVLKSGANDFIAKPFTVEELLLKCDVAITSRLKQRKLKALNEYLQEEIAKAVEANRRQEKMLELQTRHAQMGEMLSAITHQWMQPLSIISLASQNIREFLEEDDEVLEINESILRQVVFMQETMEEFKHFFKPATQTRSFCVFDAIKKVHSLIRDAYASIDVMIQGDSHSMISGYPNEFYQVIINLLNNAKDALKENRIKQGKIDVVIRQENDYIIIEISDNAGGIPESIIERIFEPYFTSKGDKGTGVGLYLSKEILHKINGDITVKNHNGGACFTLIIPRAEK